MKRFRVVTAKTVKMETDSFWEGLREVYRLRKSGKYKTVGMEYFAGKGQYIAYTPDCIRDGYLER